MQSPFNFTYIFIRGPLKLPLLDFWGPLLLLVFCFFEVEKFRVFFRCCGLLCGLQLWSYKQKARVHFRTFKTTPLQFSKIQNLLVPRNLFQINLSWVYYLIIKFMYGLFLLKERYFGCDLGVAQWTVVAHRCIFPYFQLISLAAWGRVRSFQNVTFPDRYNSSLLLNTKEWNFLRRF